jgi:triosephosphate isomerase
MKYIIGNWKSNLNTKEVENWFKVFNDKYRTGQIDNFNNLEIIVCPPTVYIPLSKKLITENNLPLKLGAQNLSPFVNGAYTGEVSAAMLSEFVEYVIIGHSERRGKFHEGDETLSEKVVRATEAGIKSILCIPDEKTPIPQRATIIAYEPVWAIGTGKSETPVNAGKIGNFLKQNYKIDVFIYGGSVDKENVSSFLKEQVIDGVLPGKASLDPFSFWEIIVNASKTI